MSDKDFKTVKPPTSGHPKGEDLVVAYESRTISFHALCVA